ncbi:hypothetical protein [Vibrio owensii]|uniref:hypothetical protein n=1 Tax=Vibrio owensii TaxID=696485 RepID=UPI0018F15A41|nr:hypothetical protein [Vibrio owensii]
MQLAVPFVYTAQIIKPRCKKPITTFIRDVVKVDIKERTTSEVPVAFRIGETNIRYDGKRLWALNLQTASRRIPRKVYKDEIIANTSDPHRSEWPCSSPAAPFKNFWQSAIPTLDFSGKKPFSTELHNKFLDSEDVCFHKELSFRKWVSDNRTDIVELAHSIAANIMIINTEAYCTTAEPRYEICTFGQGYNHGSTGLFITQSYNPNIREDFYFNANEFKQAQEKATTIASRRGDTKSLPITVNCEQEIEVLIPEAVKLKTNKELELEMLGH